MALDLSRGLIPNLYLWFGQHTGPFTRPTNTIFTYPTIRPISTRPPCIPEIIGEICDPRCPTDASDSCRSALQNLSCFIIREGELESVISFASQQACTNYGRATSLVNRIRVAQADQGITLIELPSEAEILAYNISEMYAFYLSLIRNPALNELGIRPQLAGGPDPCKIILKNEAFINEC